MQMTNALCRRNTRLASFVAGVILPVASILAAPGDPDQTFLNNIDLGITEEFYPNDVYTGAVNAVAVQSDDKIIAGGQVSRYNNTGDLLSLRRINPDGTLDASFNSGGTGPTDVNGSSEVNAIYVLPDDSMYIGGTFTHYNGVARNCIAKLNADGTLDTSFDLTGLSGGTRFINSIAVQPDGKILVVGGFSQINGAFRQNVARLNPDGTLDHTFTLADYTSPPSSLNGVAILPDGRILLVGNAFGGRPYIRMLFSNGQPDESFAPAYGSGFGNFGAVLAHSSGLIIVGGARDIDLNYNNTLVAYNPDGSFNSAFMANLGSGLDGYAGYSLKEMPDGRILIGSRFRSIDGQYRESIAIILANGEIDETFAPQPHTTVWEDNLTHFYDVDILSNGKIVGGGWFTRISDPDREINNLILFEGYPLSGAGTFYLKPSYIEAVEGKTVTVQVSRVGGNSGSVSVDLGVLGGGTATAGIDFNFSGSTLTWADGETGSKSISIELLVDESEEGTEFFSVGLSNATGGASISSGNSFTEVTILDLDSPPVIVSQTGDDFIFASQPANFKVTFQSATPATFQWYFNGALYQTTNGPALTVNATTESNSGEYKLVITNEAGFTESEPFTLIVKAPAGTRDLDYGQGTGFNQGVSDILVLDDGSAIYVGNFSSFNAEALSVNYLAKLDEDGNLDESWPNLVGSPNSQVSKVTVYPEGSEHAGKFLITGNFTNIGGVARNRIARLHSDGSLDETFTSAVTSGSAARAHPLSDGTVLVSYSQNGSQQGNLYILSESGSILSAYGPANFGTFHVQEDGKIILVFPGNNQTSIYRLNPDLSIDPDFLPIGPFTGNNGVVNDIAVDAEGRIYLVGNFFTVAGNPANRIARLLPDGAFDETFVSLNFGGNISSILLEEDGRIIVSGAFNGITIDDVYTGYGHIVRLLPNGELDDSFFTGSGANGSVMKVVADNNGGYLLGGGFSSFANQTRGSFVRLIGGMGTLQFATATKMVAEQDGTVEIAVKRISGSREVVTIDWAITGGTATMGDDYTIAATSGTLTWEDGDYADKLITLELVDDMVVEGDETIIFALSNPTNLSSLGEIDILTLTILDNDSVASITRQPQSVTIPELTGVSFVVEATSATEVSYQWRFNGGDILGATEPTYNLTNVGFANAGEYTVLVTNAAGSIESEVAVLTVLPSPTALDSTFLPGQINFYNTTVANSIVRTVLPLSDGSALAGGSFNITALPAQRSIAKVFPDGTRDTSFSLSLGSTLSHYVSALAKDNEGRIYIGGNFTTVNGQPAAGLVRLNPDLTVDTDFLKVIGSGVGLNGSVDTITIYGDEIYIGGSFNSFNNKPGTISVARLLPTGEVDPTFGVYHASSGNINRIIRSDDDYVYLFGNVAVNYGGLRINRLNLDGSHTTGFSPTVNNQVYNAVEIEDGFIIGGAFTNATYPYLARIGTNGANNAQFLSGINPNGVVRGLARQTNGKILVGGAFTTVGGETINRYLRLNADYTVDTGVNLGTGFNGEVHDIVVDAEGRVWVAGAFTSYNGTAVNRLVRLYGDDVAVAIKQQPADALVAEGATAQFEVVAVGLGTLSYQWYRNGVALSDGSGISGAQTSVLSIASVDTGDVASYSVRVTNSGEFVDSRVIELAIAGEPEVISVSGGGTYPADIDRVLTVKAKGLAPLSYQWKKDGVDIEGANTSSLVISKAGGEDSGNYTVVVSNSLGDVTSDVIELEVVDPAPATPVLRLASPPATSITYDQVLPLPDGRMLIIRSNATPSYVQLIDQAGVVDSSFPLFTGASSYRPVVIHRQKNGGYLIGGGPMTVGGVTRHNLVRLNPDFTLDEDFAAVPLSAGVSYIVELPDGRIAIGGAFDSYNDAPNTSRVIILNADGTRDTSFSSMITSAASVNGLVYDPDDETLVLGMSTNVVYDGVSSSLHKVYLDGTRKPTVTVTTSPIGVLVRQDDGKLLIGGNFYYVHGLLRVSFARLNSDFSLDTDFVANTYELNGPISQVQSITINSEGKIVVAGAFRAISGRATRGVAALNSDGSFDSMLDLSPYLSASDSVDYATFGPDGKLYLAGSFVNYDGVVTRHLVVTHGFRVGLNFAQEPASQMVDPGAEVIFEALGVGTTEVSYQWYKGEALLTGETNNTLVLSSVEAFDEGYYSVVISNESGSLESVQVYLKVLGAPEIVRAPEGGVFFIGEDVTLTSDIIGAGELSYQWYRNGQIIEGATGSSLTITDAQSGDSGNYAVEVTNDFGTLTTTPVSVSVLFDPAAWYLGFPSGTGTNSAINAVVPLEDGGVILGGNFTQAKPTTSTTVNVGYIVKYFADGTVDTDFVATFNAQVQGMLQDANGSLYVRGVFTQANGEPANYLAKLNADGSLDETFMSNFTGVTGWGSLTTVNSMALQPDGKLMIAGFFDTVNGVARNQVARLNSDGTLDSSFPSLTFPISYAQVNEVVVEANGNILIRGLLDGFDNALIRLSPTGVVDTSFANVRMSGTTGVLPLANGKILVSRTSPALLNSTTQVYRLFRLNNDGTFDETFVQDPAFTGNISRMVEQENGRIVIGGNFFNSGYLGSGPYITRLESGGSRDLTFDTTFGAKGFNSQPNIVNALALDDFGGIWLGMNSVNTIVTYRGEVYQGLVVLNGDRIEPVVIADFNDWLDLYVTDSAQRAPFADADRDGVPNIIEYAFNMEGNKSDREKLPRATRLTGEDLGLMGDEREYLTITFTLREFIPDLTVTVLAGETSNTADMDSGNAVLVGEPVINGGLVTYTYRSTFNLEDAPLGFMSVNIQYNP